MSVIQQYYVRIRGRVQGPFDEDKVRTLARRGQISRLHEISTDGTSWGSGANYPELFATGTANDTTVVQQLGNSASASEAVASSIQTAVHAVGWFYAQGNKELGPVDGDTLRGLLASRQIKPDTLVWREGMAQWVPADRVSELLLQGTAVTSTIDHGVSHIANGASNSKAEEISPTIVRALRGSRGWVLFLAIVGYVFAALTMAGGLLLVIIGSREHTFPVVAQGLFSIVQGIVWGAGAFMLNVFANRISKFSAQRNEQNLVGALDSMRNFWGFAGIVSIVGLTLLLILVITVFSMGMSLKGY